MRLNEVLAQIEGLNKRFVYYLEAQGYIQPTKIRKSRISRRDYSQEDVDRLRELWGYYRRGYSVQGAQQLAEQAERLSAYVLLAVPTGRWAETLQLLSASERVREVSFVYGETANVVLRLAAPDEREIYAVLNEAFAQAAVAGVPKILKVERTFARPGGEERKKERAMQAYVMIKVPAKQAGGVLEELKQFSGVVEASVIYGETDIVARLMVPDQDELDDLIINRIQGLPAVESTRTFVVVGRLQWRR